MVDGGDSYMTVLAFLSRISDETDNSSKSEEPYKMSEFEE